MRFLTVSLFSALLSAPAFAADLGTYRPGTPYNSAVAAGADVCDSQCSGDAQCRGWNYVKPNPQAAGICEFMSTVSAPISSQISISGENISAAPFSSRVTSGATNTIRVGTQPSLTSTSNTVKVGQSPSGRRVVRQAPTRRVTPQQTSTQSVENMSLTAQQNRYRQGQAIQPNAAKQAPVRQASRQAVPQQRPMFRPILDAPSAQRVRQPQQPNFQQPQLQQQRLQQPQGHQAPQRQVSRRVTGPRRVAAQRPTQAPVQASPIYNGQAYQAPQNPMMQNPAMQNPMAAPNPVPQQRGQSRPPVGRPIQASQNRVQPRPSTPSQRLAQLTAQARTQAPVSSEPVGPISLNPEQAQKSLFGRLNDDIRAPQSSAVNMPTASAVPTQPVTEQPLGEILAGGR